MRQLFSYAATRLLPDNNAASGYFSMLGRAAGVLQLTSEAINLYNAIKSGDIGNIKGAHNIKRARVK